MFTLRRVVGLVLLLFIAPAPVHASRESELAAARAVFEKNLDAIRNKDRDAYLSCYWQNDSLTRNGPGGVTQGYEDWAAGMGDDWPTLFEGADLRLVWLHPGVVYGSYRYRVRFGAVEQTGVSERVFLDTEEGWRIAVTTAFVSPDGTPPPPLALVGGTLVDGNGGPPVADAVVVVRDGRIECVGTPGDCPIPDGVRVVDAAGMWITPGLIDAGVHLSQTGFADGRPDALDLREHLPYEIAVANLRDHPERLFNAYLGSGVTAVFDNGGYAWTVDLARRSETDTRAPRLRATGPPVSTRVSGWPQLHGESQFLVAETPEEVGPVVGHLVARGSQAVMLWIIPGGKPLETLDAIAQAAGRAATEAELPLIVSATALRDAKSALRAGASMLTRSIDREPVDEEFLKLARETGAVYCPHLVVSDGYLRLAEAAIQGVAPAIDDPHAVVDSSTAARVGALPDYVSGMEPPYTLEQIERARAEKSPHAAENLRRIHEAGITVAMGTGGGNPLTVHGPSVFAEMEAMQAAGLSAHAVLTAATRGGAQALGRLDELGTVETGKLADLVLYGADPTEDVRHLRQIRYVMRGGELRAIEEFRVR